MRIAGVVLVLGLLACKKPVKDEAAELREIQERNRTSQVEEIKAAHEAAVREDATFEAALKLSERLWNLGRENFAAEVKRGRLPATVYEDASAALDRQAQRETSREAKAKIEQGRGYLRGDKSVEAATHFASCLSLDPDRLECFLALRYVDDVAKLPEVKTIAIVACARTSQAVKPDYFVDIMEGCIAIAGGDRSQLTWNTAAKDLRRYDAEVARAKAEKEEKAAEEVREREARAVEREREQHEALEGWGQVDDSKRLDKCERCKNGQCKSQYTCMWTGLNERNNAQIRYCGPGNWGMSDTKKHCMDGK